jgi:hypothetical protein
MHCTFVLLTPAYACQLTEAVEDPTPRTLIGAAMFVIVPLTLALIINHAFRRMRPAE